jgi:hypothetical protein
MGACVSTAPESKHHKNPPKSRNLPALAIARNSQGMDQAFTQNVLVPSYFYPGCQDWTDMINCMTLITASLRTRTIRHITPNHTDTDMSCAKNPTMAI